MLQKGKIGVFDSGYGGLTILREIVKTLPQYDYIYLGDNARAPYGNRSFETIYTYTSEAVDKLFRMGCELVILACNTASAKALRTIQQVNLLRESPEKRVLGVIRPSVEALQYFSHNGHIAILATHGTVNSDSYTKEIEKLYGSDRFHITQYACPMWVPLVENNELSGVGAEYFVSKYLDDLFRHDSDIDTVVLACTHYPLLKPLIERMIPDGVKIVGQGHVVADSLKDYLQRHPEMERILSKNNSIEYYTTDNPLIFERVGSIFMKCKITCQYVQIC